MLLRASINRSDPLIGTVRTADDCLPFEGWLGLLEAIAVVMDGPTEPSLAEQPAMARLHHLDADR